MAEISFVLALESDQDQLLQLLAGRQEESNQLHNTDQKFNFLEAESLFEEMLKNENVKIFLAKEQNQVVATVTLYYCPRIRVGGYVVILEDVLVEKSHRGKGIGKQLIQHVIDFCQRDPKVKKIKLGCRKEEPGVLNFYEKQGFAYKENLLQLKLN